MEKHPKCIWTPSLSWLIEMLYHVGHFMLRRVNKIEEITTFLLN